MDNINVIHYWDQQHDDDDYEEGGRPVFFSSESHPEHMSHPAYQKLPPLCLCLVEIREKRKQMQKKTKKKKPAGFCLFYLPVLFFLFCVLGHM